MNARKILFIAGIATAGVVAGIGLRSVLAGGIPATNPLYYSGTLTENGTLVTGTRDITLNLWPAQTGGTTPLCQTLATGSTPAQVTNGRFRVALASDCKGKINANSSVYVEVFDGTTSLGRTAIGAVPYAVEADHATTADQAASSSTTTAWQPATGLSCDADQQTTTGAWRRVGDSIDMQIVTTFSGTPTTSGIIHWGLPAGIILDTAKMDRSGPFGIAGVSSATSSNTVCFAYGNSATSTATKISLICNGANLATPTTPQTLTAGAEISMRVSFPVAGWSP